MNVLPKPTPDSRILTGNHEVDSLYMKELLIVANLSQAEVGRQLGVSRTMVNKFIARRDNSSRVLTFFEQLANHFDDKLRRLHVNVKQ
jgi:predicted transcriptional regulator